MFYALQLVFLQCDRYVEFHPPKGRYFRLRIPKFGRDFSYHAPSCDLHPGRDHHYGRPIDEVAFLNASSSYVDSSSVDSLTVFSMDSNWSWLS
jgi:hypothetical protein